LPKKAEIEFVQTKKFDLSSFTLIEGFPGLGLVGTISSKYLVEKLGFEEIGYIKSNIFVPVIRIHKGELVRPSRIYASKRHKIAVIVSEQIIPTLFTEDVANAVVAWILGNKIKRLISLSGIRAPESECSARDKNCIYGIAANARSKKFLEKHGIKAIQEGITSGITSLILLDLKETSVEAVSILANVHLAADYDAASEILKKLDELAGLKIDIKPLKKEAKETEAALLKHMKELKKEHEEVKKFEERTPMYT